MKVKTDLDPALQATSNLAQRFFVADADRERSPMHPLVKIQLLHDGAVLGGGPPENYWPPDLQIFEAVHKAADQRDQTMMAVWYKGGDPVYIKANRLGISRAKIYTEIGKCLSYYRGALRAKGLTV